MSARRHDRALADLAKEALRHGRAYQAAAILNQARETPPRDPNALRTLADVALVLRDTAAAADFLAGAISAHAPEAAPPAWYRVLGEARAMQGKLDEAIHAFRAALAERPDDADTWLWLARSLRTVDDLPAAIVACRRAVELAPEGWQALGELATVLMEARAFDEAAALFDEAAARAGDVSAISVARAKLDAQCGRRPEAIAALRACVARHPRYAPALAALALTLRDERRYDEAVATFQRAVTSAPEDAALCCGLGRTLLEAGRADEALTVAATYLTRRPGHAGALSLSALARQALGDEQGAQELLDHDRFVVRRRLPLPEGFADLSSFNVALAEIASTHPTLHRAPLSHATVDAFHSGSLLIDPPKVIRSLQQALHSALADYFRALPDRLEHPFVSREPASTLLDIWCVVMESGGHQIPHIHPNAWLSGVYYPRLPERIRSGEGPDGWLMFGEPDRDFPRRVEPRIVPVRPEEGLLVLFPSYFFHRTIPFEAEGKRVSIAFDLVRTA